MNKSLPQWQEYWEASKLSTAGAIQFGERVRDFRPLVPPPEPFVQSGPESPLPMPHDRLQSLMRKRESARAFSAKPLSSKDIGRVFSAFASDNGRRVYPSAGGLYPVHAFGLMINCDTPYGGTAVRYEPSTHSLGRMSSLPDVDEATQICSVDDGFSPQMIVVFVLYMDELERKYGERALRFALLEAGHAAQNLALRLANSKMVGYELGGLQDQKVKALLGLTGTSALIAHGYACGR